MFYVHPYLGKIPILTNIFQLGWNHQLVCIYIYIFSDGLVQPPTRKPCNPGKDYGAVVLCDARFAGRLAGLSTWMRPQVGFWGLGGWSLETGYCIKTYETTMYIYLYKLYICNVYATYIYTD